VRARVCKCVRAAARKPHTAGGASVTGAARLDAPQQSTVVVCVVDVSRARLAPSVCCTIDAAFLVRGRCQSACF
jgi:hypothetical protein